MSWLLAQPRQVAPGLLLRTATRADIEALVTFNGAMHNDPTDGGVVSQRIMARVREWLDGSHPLIGPEDFLVVEETTSRQIVSSLAVLRQQWAYAGIPFTVAQTEFVGTLPAYRRRGLVGVQMEVVHRASAAAGDLMQAILGIPWYYRQFGYALTLPMQGGVQGGRAMPASVLPSLPAGGTEPYHIRPATPEDLPFIIALERQAQDRSLYALQRPPASWQHEVFGGGALNNFRRRWQIIQTPTGEPVGYLAHQPRPPRPHRRLTTLEVAAGVSWLEVVPVALRHLRALEGAVPAETVGLAGGLEHPAYTIFPTSLTLVDPPETWYIRIPDEMAFLRQIAPALEQRLAVSVAQGYTGDLLVNRYRTGIRLRCERGRIVEVTPWSEADAREMPVASAAFPEETFTHLLCGTRSLAELEAQYADCEVESEEARVVLNILFPKTPSAVWVLW